MRPIVNDAADTDVPVVPHDEVRKTKQTNVLAVHELDPLADPRWARLIETHPDAVVYHSVAWLKALRSAYGYAPVVLSLSDHSDPLRNGLVFCRIKSWLTGSRMVSLPFSDHCSTLVDNPSDLERLLRHAQESVDEKRCDYAEVRPSSPPTGSVAGFGRAIPYCFHRLNLSKSTAELFSAFHKDCVQRKIRRAERESLTYEEGRSEELLMKFYQLLVVTRKRQQLPPQPLAWFRALIAEFAESLKIRVASKDDTPIASILTLSFRKCVTYKYGCSDERYSKLGGTALLLWKTIQDAKDNGFEEFDLGRSDIENKGLIAFKERWGAVRTIANYWTYPARPISRAYTSKMRWVHRVCSVAPPRVLVAMGNVLYRHIG